MSVQEACFLKGIALLRIGLAADLTAWAANKERFDEATGFLQHASMDISGALAGDLVTSEQAEQMRNNIEQYEEAVKVGDGEKVQDSLAELSATIHDIAFQKVVECELRYKPKEG